MANQVYAHIWCHAIPKLLALAAKFPHFASIMLNQSEFERLRHPKHYTFLIEIEDATLISSHRQQIGARELAKMFLEDDQAYEFSRGKYVYLRLDKHFTLHISAMNIEQKEIMPTEYY